MSEQENHEPWVKPCAFNLKTLDAILSEVVAEILEAKKIKCSICGQKGHNKRSCTSGSSSLQTTTSQSKLNQNDIKSSQPSLQQDTVMTSELTFAKEKEDTVTATVFTNDKPALLTEDLGKITEYAVCLIYQTMFNGPFKYSVEKAINLSKRISQLKELLPGKYIHTGNKDNLNDFENEEDKTQHLSVKSCKKGYKICPQLIGQTSRFSEHFGLPLTSTKNDIQDYILQNTSNVLTRYIESTFHCPVLFYNEQKDEAMLIHLIKPINWFENELTFTHIEKQKEWNESTSLKCKGKTIGEFQIHNHRNCTKFRFDIKNLFEVFSNNFKIRRF